MILTSKKLFKSFVKRAELVLSLGGTVTFEWPRHNSGWNRPDVRRFFEQHPEFQSVEFDGCMLGLKSKDSRPIKKPWKLMTTDPESKLPFKGICASTNLMNTINVRELRLLAPPFTRSR